MGSHLASSINPALLAELDGGLKRTSCSLGSRGAIKSIGQERGSVSCSVLAATHGLGLSRDAARAKLLRVADPRSVRPTLSIAPRFESPLARVRSHWQTPRHMCERLRSGTEAVEAFVLEAMHGQRRGMRTLLIRGSLPVLSKIFALAVKARQALYKVHIFRDRHR